MQMTNKLVELFTNTSIFSGDRWRGGSFKKAKIHFEYPYVISKNAHTYRWRERDRETVQTHNSRKRKYGPDRLLLSFDIDEYTPKLALILLSNVAHRKGKSNTIPLIDPTSKII